MTASGRSGADFRIVAALAAGMTVEDAAKEAGVGERTVYRRLQESDFRAQVSRVRGEMMERAVGSLAGSSTVAAETLVSLAESANSEQVRLGAARAVLELGARLREQTELEARLAALEAATAARDNRRTA